MAHQLRNCACGNAVHINWNDIEWHVFVNCHVCQREACVVGWSPEENGELCVKLWNDRGWNGPTPAEREQFYVPRVQMIGPNAGIMELQWRNRQPPPPPPTLQERLEVFKRSKRPVVERPAQRRGTGGSPE